MNQRLAQLLENEPEVVNSLRTASSQHSPLFGCFIQDLVSDVQQEYTEPRLKAWTVADPQKSFLSSKNSEKNNEKANTRIKIGGFSPEPGSPMEQLLFDILDQAEQALASSNDPDQIKLKQEIENMKKSLPIREKKELSPISSPITKRPDASSPIIVRKKTTDNLVEALGKGWFLEGKELSFIKPLGTGAFSTVYLGTYRSQEVAIKVVKKIAEEQKKTFYEECKILRYRFLCDCIKPSRIYPTGSSKPEHNLFSLSKVL